MNQESFLLKWKFYDQNVSFSLQEEAKQNCFADVTLVSDELELFKAHKFILSAKSSVLKEILLTNPHPEPLIYLNGVQRQELQALLHLVYFGEAAFSTNRTDLLLSVIESFKLAGFDTNSLKGLFKNESNNKNCSCPHDGIRN